MNPPLADRFYLSDGEIHFLWHFIQGSIMEPVMRQRLRRTWGFCQRHAWGFLAIECAFRDGYLHGSAILYEDLMERAQTAFISSRRGSAAWRLRNRGPCPMCDLGYGLHSVGYAQPAVLDRGRDSTNLRRFASETRQYWERYVCGQCLGQGGMEPRCRPHLLADMSQGRLGNLEAEEGFVRYLLNHLKAYSRSFRWEWQDTETSEDRVSLISAVGWLSGWTELLELLK